MNQDIMLSSEVVPMQGNLTVSADPAAIAAAEEAKAIAYLPSAGKASGLKKYI